ncbi:hypothetical protein SAMN05443287_107145 [Micromonospora phaseoli]|uniref:Zinc-finger n=1 Tax=Micromonospora phaseoli TaxID=1144548 RepID=A0A1H7BC55_9ACTN|nr:hypothetical protein [Micromonospora phaseoli]PZV95077.1 hypothetical protein CLV64_108217 [Micromonospora phaseoli]GIJ79497.1 hypothetical protein Xph01_39290 [Micromonospora phaseoli]SEJ74736.1 hypothetical protein SAMN05443287_107145 [Micromonospora phaseoli]
MSTGEFSEVDHDLLADYLGGALDGTLEQVEIARLVAQDPAWAQAHALLAPALEDVRAELAGWGESAPELPPEIADRIRTALAVAEDVDLTATDDESAVAAPLRPVVPPPGAVGKPDVAGEPDPAGKPESTGGKAAVVPVQPLGGSRRPGGTPRPGQERSVPSRPGRRRRRWARVAGPVALAAATVVGLGALQLSRANHGDDAASGTAYSDRGASPVVPQASPPDSAADAAPERASAAAALPPFQIVGEAQRSGTDYTPQTLSGMMPAVGPFSTKSEPAIGGQSDERLPGPGDLARLGEGPALNACLAEISAEHGGTPLVVDVVDYARFEGLPALVVRFTDGSGAQWAWVSGPECGVPGSGSDARYRTQVG